MHFRIEEFECRDGACIPVSLHSNVRELMKNLEVLRGHFGVPITINSAYRTVSHNKRIGGSPKSQHLQAKASDIVVKGVPPKKVYETIEKLIGEGKMKQGGLGLYKTFVHYDIRGVKARWVEGRSSTSI